MTHAHHIIATPELVRKMAYPELTDHLEIKRFLDNTSELVHSSPELFDTIDIAGEKLML